MKYNLNINNLKEEDINKIVSELKKINEIPETLSKYISDIIFYQNKVIEELTNIVHHYEGEQSTLETLETSLKEFKKQHNLARSLQSCIFPTSLPNNNIISITAKLNPMYETSGDFYDVIELIPNSVYGVFVVDIQGHGVSAALVTNLAKMLFVRAAERYVSPKDVMGYINKEICDILNYRSFFTAFYIVIDFPNKQFSYSSGGHTYNIRYNVERKEIEVLSTKDTIIGVIRDNIFEEKTTTFKVGDRIFIYTDGIPEAKTRNGKMFGDKRIYEILKENPEMPPNELIEHIETEVKTFTGKKTYDDDVTLLLIDIKSDKEKAEGDSNSDIEDAHSRNEVNRIIEYYKKSIEIKQQQNDISGIIKNTKLLGDKLLSQGKYKEGLEELKKAEKLLLDNNETSLAGNVYLSLCNAYFYMSEPDNAINYGLKALEEYEKSKFNEGIATTYNLISISYGRKGDSNKSKEYILKALEVASKEKPTPNIMRLKAILYNNLGFAYGKESNVEGSLDSFLKSFELAENCNFELIQPTLMNNIGDIYRIKGEYDKALKYFHKGLHILEEVDNKNLLGIILLNTSNIYLKKDEKELSFYYLKKAIEVTKKYNITFLESAVKSVRAYNYMIIDKIEEFIQDAKDCINLNEKLKFDPNQGLIKVALAMYLAKVIDNISPEIEKIIETYYNGNKNPEWFFEDAINESSNPMNTDTYIPALYEYAIYLYQKSDEKSISFFKQAIQASKKYENYSERKTIRKIIKNIKSTRKISKN